MCGIVGAIDLLGQRPFAAPRLTAMADALAHRGPDGSGQYLGHGIALAARRLAIVDVVGGQQPVANETGDVQVTFNGELFEHASLRLELLSRGHQLKSQCDTELWAHWYEDQGADIFAQARGQFAVAIWDQRQRTLLLARDRVGICPLYYCVADGWLVWASEIKGLFASGLVRAEPDRLGVDQFFNSYCSGPTRTCFAGISALAPGHVLKVSGGEVVVRRYWQLSFPAAGEERVVTDDQALIDEFDALCARAVRRRLSGDLPVASYLSGGVDSTYILGQALKAAGGGVPAFSIGFAGAGVDESRLARANAAFLNTPLTIAMIGPHDLADAYPALTEAAEMPVFDTASAALLRLARRVHEDGYKVVMTGEGADEALAGYVWFKTQRLRRGSSTFLGKGVVAAMWRHMLSGIGRGHYPPQTAWPAVRPAQQDVYDIISQSRVGLYSEAQWAALAGRGPFDDLPLPPSGFEAWDPLNQSLYFGYQMMLPGLLLSTKGDRVAMAASVEARYPFLDEDVVDFCATLPVRYKLRGLTEKWLLRQAAAKLLPPAAAHRPKRMFRARSSAVFLGAARPRWVDQLLSPESLAATGYFAPDKVAAQRRLQTLVPGWTIARAAYDVGLMSVIATQLWHHLFIGGGLCDLPARQLTAFGD